MKYLVFTLSMPKVNTWNGHWSGENDKHVKAVKLTTKQEKQLPDIINKDFGYRWEDGWYANVHVQLVDSASEKNHLIKGSKGFCGYDWMIQSLIKHGRVIA